MTLQGLFENSILDALGLLDERELAEYNAAFAAAPAQVRAQIRAEQARWANPDFLLPKVEAPEDLRARVLDSVRMAMLKAQADAPSLELRPSARVSRAWRTASLGLSAVALVLGGAFLNVMSQNETMRSLIVDPGTQREVLAWLGGTNHLNDTLFRKDCQRIIFDSQSHDFGGLASIQFAPGWDHANFTWTKLPALKDQTYRLAVVNDDLQVARELANLGDGSDKGISYREIAMNNLAKGTRLAIVACRNGSLANATVVMTAQI